MKKSISVLISIILSSVMLLSFTACKNDTKTSTDAPETSASAAEVTYAEKLGEIQRNVDDGRRRGEA